MIDFEKEVKLLDALNTFSIPVIPSNTRFWMIRTQKGYFYEEFLSKKFVALAWNIIDQHSDFSDSSRERLKDSILIEFPEINRPSTVINKCAHFIFEVKTGDILVIPSKGSQYITFAIAGEYFEDSSKSVKLEKEVIYRIKNNDVDINDVSCPYKKRRHIKLLRTIKSEYINYSLYRAISNYHGISNLDAYSRQILNHLYNYYSFNNDVVLVYDIWKNGSIKPRELNGLLYGSTECLARMVPEDNIYTQISLHSPGDVVFILKQAYDIIKDNWVVLFGLLIFLGGGSVLTFKVPGIIDIVKNILSAPSDIKLKKHETDLKELEVLEKRVEIYNKIKSSGIKPEDLEASLKIMCTSAESMQAEPIILGDDASILPVDDAEISEITETE